MGAENSITAPSAVQCGACTTHNLASATFCKGCGHSLFEPCAACAKSVLLTQKFCESCGADLEKDLRSRHQQNEAKMSEAVTAARESEFERAIGILTKIACVQDYRFKKSVEDSKQAIAKIERLRDQAHAVAREAMTAAKRELESGNQSVAVQLLESVPRKLLSDDARKDLARIKALTAELATLQSQLKAGIESKDWPLVGRLVDLSLNLTPRDQQYRKLGKQVSEKLITLAKRSLSSSQYSAASDLLDSVPAIGRTKEFDNLSDSVEDIRWLSQQFGCEPFVTPMLGRLAVRFAKEVPDNQETQQLVKRLAARLKTGERAPRTHLPAWKGATGCWMGGTASVLGLPSSLGLGSHELMRSRAGRFSVAIGLALQGLGMARTSDHFCPKQGLLGGLARRKKNVCWGVDMGTASMKAVCIENGEDGLAVVDCFFEELETPLCRANVQSDKLNVIKPAVERFLEEHELEGIPIWGNITGSQLITRFVRLPPLKQKHLSALLKQEIEQKIPLPMDELAVATWIQPARGNGDDVHGRPAVITAARQSVIDDRLELLRQAGLELTGLQADSTALANFVAFEFADLFLPQEAHGDASLYPVGNGSGTPAIAILDCGAATTNLVLVSGETHWLWTGESGGEDLTTALARVTKTTHTEAEQLKRDPAALQTPARHYQAVEQKQDEVRARVQTVLDDALHQNTRFEIVQSWCVGGGCQAHEWIRRIMTDTQRDLERTR